MPTGPHEQLLTRLAGLGGAGLLLVDDLTPGFADEMATVVEATDFAVEVAPLSTVADLARSTPWSAVVVLAATRGSLRAAVSGLGAVGRSGAIACWLAHTRQPLALRPLPQWPRLRSLMARPCDDGSLTVARFHAAVPAAPVLVELARQSVGGDDRLAVPLRLLAPGWRPDGLDAALVRTPGAAGTTVPPDIVLDAEPGATTYDAENVLMREPVSLARPQLPPLDERIVNPIGFRRAWETPTVRLDGAGRLELPGGSLSPERYDDTTVAALRSLQGVDAGDISLDQARAVAALAMAGVPVVGRVAGPVRAVLGDEFADAIAEPVDLADPLQREEHSVVLRRTALESHSVQSWRQRAAATASVTGQPTTVSVVLATFRPDQVDFAVRQIAAQRRVDLEVIVAGHGFTPDRARVEELAGGLPVTTLGFDRDEPFGSVLTKAARVATGAMVLKWDDDDHYSRDFVRDLLLARRYSGADLVGVAAEFVHLATEGVTVRRRFASEIYAADVAGGSMLIDRGLLLAAGGFRSVRKYVDAQLLRAVTEIGGVRYRTHGLGYLLHRGSAGGHTWQVDGASFRAHDLVAEYPGQLRNRVLSA